jgi:hypothetical protein
MGHERVSDQAKFHPQVSSGAPRIAGVSPWLFRLAHNAAPLLNAVIFNADEVRANISRDLGFGLEDRIETRGAWAG